MGEEDFLRSPDEIEKKSMQMISDEMPDVNFSEGELEVVKRCIHATADFDYAKNLTFTPGVVELACAIFKEGSFTIVTDTEMARAGINKGALKKLGGRVCCFMGDEDVAREARERKITRAAVSMERAALITGPLVIASGNAPTALLCLDKLVLEKKTEPAFVIAAPVGFVNVTEAKEKIFDLGIPCIVARGRKGGSGVAAAICNALLYRALR